jgi:hypothetical protein
LRLPSGIFNVDIYMLYLELEKCYGEVRVREAEKSMRDEKERTVRRTSSPLLSIISGKYLGTY